ERSIGVQAPRCGRIAAQPDDLAVFRQADTAKTGGKIRRRVEAGIQRTVGVQPLQIGEEIPISGIERSGEENFLVGLYQDVAHGARAREGNFAEGVVEGSVRVKADDTIAWAIGARNQQFAVRMFGNGVDNPIVEERRIKAVVLATVQVQTN